MRMSNEFPYVRLEMVPGKGLVRTVETDEYLARCEAILNSRIDWTAFEKAKDDLTAFGTAELQVGP